MCVCLGAGEIGAGELWIEMATMLQRGRQVSDNETQVRNKLGSRRMSSHRGNQNPQASRGDLLSPLEATGA